MVKIDKGTKVKHLFPRTTCHNFSLGFTTKARGMERLRLKVQLRSSIHIFGSAEECEGTSPHTPKWAPTLGIGVPRDFQIFKEHFEGSKFIGLKSFFIPLDFFLNVDV